jgi:hypothetical protein
LGGLTRAPKKPKSATPIDRYRLSQLKLASEAQTEASMQQHLPKDDIEISVAPHPHREGWSTMRVVFARRPNHEQRVARALNALMTPSGESAGQESPPDRGVRVAGR